MRSSRHTTRFSAAALAYALIAGLSNASAQDYPSRPIQAFLGLPAGGGADIMCRFFANKVAEMARQQIVIINKPGAFTSIAYQATAVAKPDGYSMLLTGNSIMAGGPHLVKDLPYDPKKSLVAATAFAATPFVLTVPAKSPHTSIAELVAHLKSKSRSTYGHTNPTAYLSTAYFKQLAGFEAEGVSYRTAADAVIDLEQGTLDFMIFDGTFAMAHIKSGRIRALAMTSDTRVAALPDVPTLKEVGFKDFDFNPWWGVYFPAGTPQPILDKMGEWFRQVAASPEAQKFLADNVLQPLPEDAGKAAARLEKDVQMWDRLAKLAGLQPQ